jgi:acyl-CoA reductase-like NAD-dependent aldehyde dehydrogenase
MSESKTLQGRLEQAARLADVVRRRRYDLAEASATDAGFPVRVTLLEAELAADYLETLHEERDWVEGGLPFGTVSAIFPYDAPVVMLGRLGGSALLTDNRLRFSFSSLTPRSAHILAEMSRSVTSFEAVQGRNNREFGMDCVADEGVRVLFISGSSAVGEVYRRHHRSFDKLFFAGPGGMPAAVVFADADIETAARFICRRAFINGGQYCTTLKKALIHRSLYDAVRTRILEGVAKLKVGDPLSSDTDIGPILAERTRKLLQQALSSCSDGVVLTGGFDGDWVYPLVVELEEIPDWELFGPFLALKPFDDSNRAVGEVIASRYGFVLAYFGTPPSGGADLFRQHFGMVHDNPDFVFTPLRIPFGGKKESGWILERHGSGWRERHSAFIYSRELIQSA